MTCYSESEIAVVALYCIRKRPGICTTELIEETRRIMQPNGEDLTILKDRSDDKFSQKVRNLKCHDTLKDSVYTIGEKNCQWFPKP